MNVPIKARYKIGARGEAPTLIESTMIDVPEAVLLDRAAETILDRCSGETREAAAPYLKQMRENGIIQSIE